MGGSLGPKLADIIMADCENVIVYKLIKEKVYDTFLITKKKGINYVLNQFNKFEKSLKLSVDTFENCVPYFLDIKICTIGLGAYHKNTQTGQYVHINFYTLWRWIRSLTITDKKLCSAKYFSKEIQLIKRYAAFNGYPWNVVNSIIKQALHINDNNETGNDSNINAVRIYINISYSGERAKD